MSYIATGFPADSTDGLFMLNPSAKVPTRLTRAITWLSWFNLFALLVVSLLLFAVSENWWLSSALTYAPRLPYIIPAVGLLIASVLWHRNAIPVNLISVTMVAVPIMGYSLPVSHWMASSSDSQGQTLKVITCNIQDFRPDFVSIVAEISRFNPDVVVFQDARSQSELLDQYFGSWHLIRDGEYCLASRFPARLVAIGHFDSFDRNAIMQCELELPTTSVMFFNIHQMTPRHGLRSLDISSPITQRGSERLSRYLELRDEEASDIRDFVEGSRGSLPTLIAGDFNMPSESSLYHKHWSGFQNAFAIAGSGYGYSFPCTRQYCWPAGVPWMRLDHILADESWQVRSCYVGSANGSDHRLVAATLQLKQ